MRQTLAQLLCSASLVVDIHEPDLRMGSMPNNHRTMRLVFAKEKTLSAVKDALVAGRTAVWFKDQIIGRKELLEPLFRACLSVATVNRREGDVRLRLQNNSDVDIHLTAVGAVVPPLIDIPSRATVIIRGRVEKSRPASQWKYIATNFLTAPESGLPVTLEVPAR